MMSIKIGGGRRSKSLAEQLELTLAERIRCGSYQPGAKLPSESELAAESGVSRTVVREAISRLQAAGLAETRHGIGTFVLDIGAPLKFDIDPAVSVTIQDALAMLELRIVLEVEAAGLAAARRTDAHLTEMRHILDSFEASLNAAEASTDSVGPDFNFHLKIAEATGNRYFVEIMSLLGTATIPRNRVTLGRAASDPDYLRRIDREHSDVFEAIRTRDPETARTMMRMHLAASRERLRRAREQRRPAEGAAAGAALVSDLPSS
jgi:GntR family transcriptional regulator, transcriptional repressor for pyruvate dehydrogenase complex